MKRSKHGSTSRVLLLPLLAMLAACDGNLDSPAAERSRLQPGGLRLQSVLGDSRDLSTFRRAEPHTHLSFPADHGPHPEYRSEWWYLTMMLADAQGREYGGQFTLFRQAQAAPVRFTPSRPWRTNEVYLAHLAVTDVTGNRHRSAERFSRAHPDLAGAQAVPFAVWLEDWRLASQSERQFAPLQLTALTPEFGWSLSLDADKPLVLQGKEGYSAKGPDQGSHYYSFSRLNARGTLTLGGQAIAVQGNAWFDREWSTSVLGADQVGWDWFALQLDDGRDLMLFNLRRRDCSRDPFDQGVLVEADGSSRPLTSTDFTLTALRQWQGPEQQRLVPVPSCDPSTHGGTTQGVGPWPLEWQLQLSGERLRIRAAVLDQRMQTSIAYWEGLVHVFGETGTRLGRGYMELTGY